MKVKLDENMPQELTSLFAEFGHEADSVADEGLQGTADDPLWRIAAREGRLFVTQDLDFSDIRRFDIRSKPGILLLRLADPNRPNIRRRIRNVLDQEVLKDCIGSIIVVSDNRIRVKKQA